MAMATHHLDELRCRVTECGDSSVQCREKEKKILRLQRFARGGGGWAVVAAFYHLFSELRLLIISNSRGQ
jgi:hypothetical protein